MVFLIDDLIYGIAGWLFAKLGTTGAACACAAGATSAVTVGAIKTHSAIGLSLTQHGLGLGVDLLGTGKSGISIFLGTQGLEAGLKITDNFSLGLSTGLLQSESFSTTRPCVEDIAHKLQSKSKICPDCYQTYYSFHICPELWKPQEQTLDIQIPIYESLQRSDAYVNDLSERLRTAVCPVCNSVYLKSSGHSCHYGGFSPIDQEPLSLLTGTRIIKTIGEGRERQGWCNMCGYQHGDRGAWCSNCSYHHFDRGPWCHTCGYHHFDKGAWCNFCGYHHKDKGPWCSTCRYHHKYRERPGL